MQAAFFLTESAPFLENWYVPDLEIAVFQSDQELVPMIVYYLSHPDIRDRIAAAGFERTRNDHTYEKRLHLILNFALHAKNAHMQNPLDPHPMPERNGVGLFDASKTVIEKSERLLPLLRQILVWGCNRIWGHGRGLKAARRIIFELSFRLAKKKHFHSPDGLLACSRNSEDEYHSCQCHYPLLQLLPNH